MTAPQAERAPGASGAAPALATLLLLGLLLRLTIAYVLLPGSGFGSDVSTFTAWALRLAEVGPSNFYAPGYFADYPPGYLYVLWLVGGLAHLLGDLLGVGAGAIASGLIKLPPMLADIAIGGLLFVIVRSWLPARFDGARLGLLAAAIYLFNPVTWYDSAIWGQTDSVGALVMLLGVAALLRGNSEGAAALAVLAALVKPQFGVVFVPLAGVILLRRHLLSPGSGPRNRPLVPAALRGWFEEERGAWRLLSSAVVATLLLLALITPFSLDLPGFVERMAQTAGGYDYLSVNAYNLWALIGAQGQPPLAFGGGWSPDTVPLLGSLPGVVVGGLLLAGGFLLGLARAAWRDDRRSIVLVAVFLSLAFFGLPTRVHERYLFPVFALLPLLAVTDRRWLWATVILSIASFINLHGILTTPLYATPNVANLPLGEAFRSPPFVVLSALLHSGVFLFVLWRLRPAALAEPAALSPADESVEARSAAQPWQPAPPSAGWPMGWRERLGRWTDVVPVRRDRSAELLGEGGGRLNRLDLLLLLLVFASTLVVRGVRLEEPYAMHFDEVYHARTGIEFLQHWRYGLPHSIYEYTHPHLAKYVMAAGVVTLGNNRVVEQGELGLNVRAAALERRWSPDDRPDEGNGERLYVAAADELVAYDLASRAELARLPLSAVALAIDEGGHVLYAADSAGGLWRLNTLELDLLRLAGERVGPPTLEPLVQLGELSGTVSRLAVAYGQLVVVSEAGEIVLVDPASASETARTVVPGASGLVAARSEGQDALVVGAQSGFVLLDAADLAEMGSQPTTAPVRGLDLLTDGTERPTVYGALGSSLQALELPADEPAVLGARLEMPGEVSEVLFNPATVLVHVLGRSPDGTASTVYVVEPRSFAVFADARLPSEPASVVLDTQPQRPAQDRSELLALTADGELARVDIGSNAFAWRLPGVLAGSLLAVALYLLARFLFERRSVAIIVALLVLADGMFLANSRIAMNDTYVSLFIVAAMAVFAPLWLGRWRSPAAVLLGLLAVGLLLGLALATKWVALYAIGAAGLLVLLRSALGRVLALLAMIGLTSFLGYVAIRPAPETENPELNVLFLFLMIGLTLALAAGMALRPVRLTMDEVRLAVGGAGLAGTALLGLGALMTVSGQLPAEGAVVSPGRLIAVGTALLLAAGAIFLGLRWLGRSGHGPFAPPRPPELAGERSAPPPARGWLRPGSGPLGLSWLLAMAALVVLPLAVYVVSYVPWIELGNRWLEGLPADHTGQTFLDLQVRMYEYHNYLRATHAASSPWWAWPLNLKPVWFEQQGYATDTTAVIYNTGNLVIFWLAIPAVAWVAYQAWRRRSLALTFLVVAVCCLWLPWARIDRVAFQYHIFTTLPFSFLALAYFLAELWHGPSERTFRLARVAAALMVIGPPLLWLLRLPLCAIGRVDSVNPGAEVCGALNRQLGLTEIQLGGLLLAGLGFAALAGLLWLGERLPESLRRNEILAYVLAGGGLAVGLLLVVAGIFLPGQPAFEAPLQIPELVALPFLLVFAGVAYFVLKARDSRRFVLGVLVAAGLWFVLWYPNVGGLPLPSRLAQAHLLLLPTWNYSFQFGANQDEGNRAPPELLPVLLLALIVTLLVLIVVGAIYVVRARRAQDAAERSLRALHEAG